MIELYGIPNCDTVKKSRVWLTDQMIEYQFQDFKKVSIDPAMLARWIDQLGLENILNKRGATWRKLSDDDKKRCEGIESAIPIILSNLSVIKRPLIIDNGHAVLIGFSEDAWAKHFHKV